MERIKNNMESCRNHKLELLIFLHFIFVIISSPIYSQSIYSFTSEAAPDWTRLFERTEGWFGGDGIFTIPLNGDERIMQKGARTLFIFSDTYVGDVQDGKPLPGNKMVHNSVAYLDGIEPVEERMNFVINKSALGNPLSYFNPTNEQSKPGEYYWLGDGFVNVEQDNHLFIFAYHVHETGPNVFDFSQTNISLLEISSPDSLTEHVQHPTKVGFVHPTYGRVYFGSGLLVNTEWAGMPNPDGYVYIYGLMGDEKYLIVARVKAQSFSDTESWTYWDGESWSVEKNKLKPLAQGVSNELSVTPTIHGNYLLTYQILGISDKVGIQVGESPIGPFGAVQEVYTCPEYQDGLLPYNAKAHYHLSKPGELLISYNTITLDFWNDIQNDATIYHPRFIKVKYEQVE